MRSSPAAQALNLLESAHETIRLAKSDLALLFSRQTPQAACAELEGELRDLLAFSLEMPEEEQATIFASLPAEAGPARLDHLLDIAATYLVLLSNGRAGTVPLQR